MLGVDVNHARVFIIEFTQSLFAVQVQTKRMSVFRITT